MYNKKVLSTAVSKLGSAQAPAKKRDKVYTNKEALSPFVSSEGYKQGPPPAGTNYRIQGDTLYNPTPYPIEAVSDNGIRKKLKPYDTDNTYFPGASHVDEYEDYYDDELTDDEIDELRRGGYTVEEIEPDTYKKGGSLLTKKVTCKNCGWKWDAADGGNDMTTCHKCGGQGLVHAQNGGLPKAQFGMFDKWKKKNVDEPIQNAEPIPGVQQIPEVEASASDAKRKLHVKLIDKANALARTIEGRRVWGENGPSNWSADELKKYVGNVKDFNNEAQRYERDRRMVQNGQLSTDVFAQRFRDGNWARFDENTGRENYKGEYKNAVDEGNERKEKNMAVTDAVLELTGAPSLSRIASDPLGTLKGVGQTVADVASLPVGLSVGAYNYATDGNFDMGKNIIGQNYGEGLNETLDVAAILPGLGGARSIVRPLVKSTVKGIGTEARVATQALTDDVARATTSQGLVDDAVRGTAQDVRLVQNTERSQQLGADAYDVHRGNQRVGEVSGNKTSLGDFEVTDIGVDPEFQKQGIGQEIYKQLNQTLPEGKRVKSWGAFVENNGVKPGEKTWQALEREGLAVKNDKGVYEMVPAKQTSTEAGKVEQTATRPAQYTAYNPGDKMYDVYDVNLATEIKPGRPLEDVQHKIKNLRKDLGIGPVEHLMNKYIPGYARPIPLDQGKGMLFDPTSGKLFDSNTRYWLNKEYGFDPQIGELLGGREGWAAKNYGTHKYSTSQGTEGLKYLDETDAYKKGGEKKYSRSLEAKNRLFVENRLTKKKKSKKKKIFDPNAKYFQPGGENQVECDDDGRCYETDQAQELLDQTHRTVTNALKIDRNVAEQVWNGAPANKEWQKLGVRTADQITGDPNAFACANSATRGYEACDPSAVSDADTLSNARMKSAVAAGRTPFRKVATHKNNDFLEGNDLKPGQLISFMGDGTNHMIKYYGDNFNGDQRAFMQSNGDPTDWSFMTDAGWLPNVPSTVYEYAPHYDEIQALEEQARTNPTYVPGTQTVGKLPLLPLANLEIPAAERQLPANIEDLGSRQFGGIPTLPLNKGRQVLRDWVYGADIGMLQEADGGYMDLDLTDEEIQRMRDLGHYVEEY